MHLDTRLLPRTQPHRSEINNAARFSPQQKQTVANAGMQKHTQRWFFAGWALCYVYIININKLYMAHCVQPDLHHWEVESSNLTVNKTSPLQICMTPRPLERHINHSHLCHKALNLRNHQRNGRVGWKWVRQRGRLKKWRMRETDRLEANGKLRNKGQWVQQTQNEPLIIL